ncbi:hypothetical protein Vadar_004937 [Vaccinium darrowii]|uniref:Uncharacterized protein n=1 Tax=Vaccinium darrowii TaxID=229202 RepID=A0ACB7YT63_9ERIC|nr:hypothetical protein Vadar_004937 [Vaccinium darrowii]
MGDSEVRFSPPFADPFTPPPQHSRFGPEVYEPSLPSIHREREKYFGCLVGFLQDYRNISILNMQDVIDEHWHLEGSVTVLKRAGPFYILKTTSLADRDDLLHAGPWNIHGALLLLQPWVPDVPLNRLDFSTTDLWVQMAGAPLEYMTPVMATRLGSLIGTVLSVDRGTIMQQNMEFMQVCIRTPICKLLIPGAYLVVENGDRSRFGSSLAMRNSSRYALIVVVLGTSNTNAPIPSL